MYQFRFVILYFIHLCCFVQSENPCKQKFDFTDEKCLFISSKKASWSDAKEECAKLDGTLSNFRYRFEEFETENFGLH